MAAQRFVVLVVTAVLVCTISAANPLTSLDTIFSADCKGNFRVLPDSIFSSTVTEKAIINIYNLAVKLLYDRVKCHCPDITQAQFNARYDPMTVLFNLAGQTDKETSIPCLDDFDGAKFTRDLYKLGVAFFGDTFTANIADTCTYDKWLSDGTCAVKLDLAGLDMRLQVVFKKCGGSDSSGQTMYWPYIGVHCEGNGCKLFTPCKTNADCPSSVMECRDLISFADMDELEAFASLQMMGVYDAQADMTTDQCSKDNSPKKLLNKIIAKIASYFPGATTQTDGLNMCIFKDDGAEQLGMALAGALMPQMDSIDATCPGALSEVEGKAVKMTFNGISAWDGKLANGDSATDSKRLQGTWYAGAGDVSESSDEVYLAGVGCGADIRVLPSANFGITEATDNLYGVIQSIVEEVKAVWTCRGIGSKFALNMEVYRPDFWLCFLFTHDDGTTECTNLVEGALGQSLVAMMMGGGDNGGNNNGEQKANAGKLSTLRQVVSDLRESAYAAMERTAEVFSKIPVQAVLESQAVQLFATAVDVAAKTVPNQSATLKQYMERTSSVMQKIQEVRAAHQAAMQQKKANAAEEQQEEMHLESWSTCNYETWTEKGLCGVSTDLFADAMDGAAIQLWLKNCPAVPDSLPAAFLMCKGDACSAFRLNKHCMGTATCDEGQTCLKVVDQELAQTLYAVDAIGMLLWGGVSEGGTPAGACGKFQAVVREPNPSVPEGSCMGATAWKSDFLKVYDAIVGTSIANQYAAHELQVCLPMDMDKLETIPEKAGEIFNYQGMDHPQELEGGVYRLGHMFATAQFPAKAYSEVRATLANDPADLKDFVKKVAATLKLSVNNLQVAKVTSGSAKKFGKQEEVEYSIKVHGVASTNAAAAALAAKLLSIDGVTKSDYIATSSTSPPPFKPSGPIASPPGTAETKDEDSAASANGLSAWLLVGLVAAMLRFL